MSALLQQVFPAPHSAIICRFLVFEPANLTGTLD